MPNSPDYPKLRTLLESRIQIISNTTLRDEDPAEQLRQLQQVSEDISKWGEETKGIPQQLNHYLKQSSLSKALDYLNEI